MAVVACNLYVSLASRKSLLPLFRLAVNDASALLVHTFVDPVYQRSSFHWTGPPDAIAAMASRVALAAFDAVDDTEFAHGGSAHPAVGRVDHIAVLPLPSSTMSMTSTTAKAIGSHLEQQRHDVRVLFYGGAHAEQLSLATVRRQETSFFQSSSAHPTGTHPSVVVGAPPHFVENYNIRIRSTSRAQAQSLTRHVRAHDGMGLDHVEALTLPYGSSEQWEVACNLTRPHVTGAHDIDAAVDRWLLMQQQRESVEVVKRYRVGTTATQCQQVWDHLLDGYRGESDQQKQHHDARLREEFEAYFHDPTPS